MKQGDHYTASNNHQFEILALWCPNEEADTWVRYRNTQTLQEYTCRQEAFLSRFSPLPS